MKLKHFEQKSGYQFRLFFENGEVKETDLKPLIAQYVNEADLTTARIDRDWGCLEFKNGMVDIEPKTLYRSAC